MRKSEPFGLEAQSHVSHQCRKHSASTARSGFAIYFNDNELVAGHVLFGEERYMCLLIKVGSSFQIEFLVGEFREPVEQTARGRVPPRRPSRVARHSKFPSLRDSASA